jgi:hypothetical protein
MAHPAVKPLRRRRLAALHASFNPAAVQRQIQALCDDLLTLATAKNQPITRPAVTQPASGQHADGGRSRPTLAVLLREATKRPTRTH